LIREISIVHGGFDSPIAIQPIDPPPSSGNWVTVIIGENGTKKSFLLRLLTEAALGKAKFRLSNSRRYATVAVDDIDRPVRVIAISGTPLDRFPRSGVTNLSMGKSQRLNVEEPFVYLGQRAANGMAGVGQSERSLVGSLLSNRGKLFSRRPALEQVFSRLGLRARIEVKVRLAPARDGSAAKAVREGTLTTFRKIVVTELLALLDRFQEDGSLANRVKEIEGLQERLAGNIEAKRIRSILAAFAEPKFAFSLAPIRSGPKPDSLTLGDWELFLRIGIVEIEGTQFFRLKTLSGPKINIARSPLQGHELSSGQWSWLNGFAGLVVELRPNSLVLVDEPENSLHPAWQRDYVPTIEKIISKFEAVQVIIATHSPFVASGVSPASGNVRHLIKRFDKESGLDLVSSIAEDSTFGWTANDVYESMFDINSTRAEAFTLTANLALKAIRNNDQLEIGDHDQVIKELRLKADSLPQFDPLRIIFKDIVLSLTKLGHK
jgi:hypothetical protein